MTWLSIKRVVRTGFLNFWRNSFISFSSILSMVNTLFIIALAMLTSVILLATLDEFRNKADITVYFATTAEESEVFTVRDSLQAQPQVASVTYLSREEALAAFRERHKNDQLVLQSLEELGDNPFGAALIVKAKDLSQYAAIGNFLKSQDSLGDKGLQNIEKISYFDEMYRNAIDRLTQITDSARWIGLVLIAIFVLNTIATSFNTLRLVIYSSRDEIQVMRLVGAGQTYIRAPFVVEGMLYGLVAAVVTLLLLYPVTWWLGSATSSFFSGINVFEYYLSNFFLFFGVIMGSGIGLGALSSFLAVRRYLKI